jgi:hypothetical protein
VLVNFKGLRAWPAVSANVLGHGKQET